MFTDYQSNYSLLLAGHQYLIMYRFIFFILGHTKLIIQKFSDQQIKNTNFSLNTEHISPLCVCSQVMHSDN